MGTDHVYIAAEFLRNEMAKRGAVIGYEEAGELVRAILLIVREIAALEVGGGKKA